MHGCSNAKNTTVYIVTALLWVAVMPYFLQSRMTSILLLDALLMTVTAAYL